MSMQNIIPKFEIPSMPNTRETDKLTKPILEQAIELKIKDEDGYIVSWAFIEAHDKAIAKIGEQFDPFVAGLHGLHKMAVALRARFLDPVLASKDRLLALRKEYRIEQERQTRIKADHDAEILRKAQQKDFEKEAKQLEKVGQTEAAAVIREQAKTLLPPVVFAAPAVPKQSGSVEKTRWIATVTNYDLVPIEYKTLDHMKKAQRELIDSKIQGVVDKLGDQIKIAGVEIRKDSSEHSRAVR
jgi:hypothetical protein